MEFNIDKAYKEDDELCFEISNSELMSSEYKNKLLNSNLIVNGFGLKKYKDKEDKEDKNVKG